MHIDRHTCVLRLTESNIWKEEAHGYLGEESLGRRVSKIKGSEMTKGFVFRTGADNRSGQLEKWQKEE